MADSSKSRATSSRQWPIISSKWPEGTTREQTFCCGGGGGLLTDDLLELRVKGALPRMEALQQAVDEHGVNFMATICAICKAQFTKVLPIYGFDRRLVGGVHQLVSNAIKLATNNRGVQEICQQLPKPRKRFNSVVSRTVTRKSRHLHDKIFQASYSYKCPTYIQSTPPCQGSCPAGEDIRGYLAHHSRHREAARQAVMPWQEYAWRRLTEANPFPSVMGRVCPAPCESGCNRNEVEDHVGINSVEHFLGEYAIANNLKYVNKPTQTYRQEGCDSRRRPWRLVLCLPAGSERP